MFKNSIIAEKIQGKKHKWHCLKLKIETEPSLERLETVMMTPQLRLPQLDFSNDDLIVYKTI